MAKKKTVKKKAVKKKVAKKKTSKTKVAASPLSAKLEKTIEKDFQACEESAANWRRSKRMDRET